MSDDTAEVVIAKQGQESSLGKSLTAARELRGLSRAAAEQETHIPHHYLCMLENDDYALISDQLYLLPFLRKYATFLGLDQEETGMRFVREVQRADNNPPARMDAPLDDVRHYRRHNWTKPVMFAALIIIVVGAYRAEARHRDMANNVVPAVVSALPQMQAAVLSPGLKESNAMSVSASANPASATSGLPVVASGVPAIPEVMTMGSGQRQTNQAISVQTAAVPSDPLPVTDVKSPTAHRAGMHRNR